MLTCRSLVLHSGTGGSSGIQTGGSPDIHTDGFSGVYTGGFPGIHIGGYSGIQTGGSPDIHTGGSPGIYAGGTSGVHTGGHLGIHAGGTSGVHTGGSSGIRRSTVAPSIDPALSTSTSALCCLLLCLSLCENISGTARQVFIERFSAGCIRPFLVPSLGALRYAIYFRFYGCFSRSWSVDVVVRLPYRRQFATARAAWAAEA